jgi:hypothetical protein
MLRFVVAIFYSQPKTLQLSLKLQHLILVLIFEDCFGLDSMQGA